MSKTFFFVLVPLERWAESPPVFLLVAVVLGSRSLVLVKILIFSLKLLIYPVFWVLLVWELSSKLPAGMNSISWMNVSSWPLISSVILFNSIFKIFLLLSLLSLLSLLPLLSYFYLLGGTVPESYFSLSLTFILGLSMLEGFDSD